MSSELQASLTEQVQPAVTTYTPCTLQCGSTCRNSHAPLAHSSSAAPSSLPPSYASITSGSETLPCNRIPNAQVSRHHDSISLNRRPSAISPNASASGRRQSFASFHPRIAVLLGVNARWHIPLQVCRAASTAPAAWWGLRCAVVFLGELLRADVDESGCFSMATSSWPVEKRFRVTEVFLAILWCSASAYLSFFFADCLMSRWLLHYTPSATILRLLTTNALIAYISSWVLYLSGAAEDRRMLLPAWVSIATTLTLLYHLTQRKINIKKETSASLSVFSIASFITMCSLLLQLHLTRENDPIVPLFVMLGRLANATGL